MNIQNSNISAQNVAFAGHKKKLDKQGYPVHKFFYLYDPNKYNCEVELYNISKNKKGDLSLAEKDPAKVFPMGADGSATVDIDSLLEINSDTGFAYRFKLTDKTGKEAPSYAFDNGTVIGIFSGNTDDKFNVVLNNRAIINKNGAMQLIMPDEYYPGVEMKNGTTSINEGLRSKALASVRTHATKLGGNLAGIIHRLPELQNEGVKRIVGTPFTKDTISSHLYWTENAYRVAPSLGTDDDFKKLQVELCKNGINWIADAALVNEGFGGIHLSEVLRKGPDAVCKDMFRADEKISLGIIPDKTEHTRLKIINAPFSLVKTGGTADAPTFAYQAKNPDYDPKKPTYIQFYDDRLASKEQVESDSPMRLSTYDNINTDNIYDITRHDDAVYPFPIEVNPSELTRNVRNLYQDEGKVDLGSVEDILSITDFTYFNVVNKSAAGGLEVWDGNVDIAKLNFYAANKDDARFSKLPAGIRDAAYADFVRGGLAVRDYAINSGKYWTKLAADTQLAYVAEELARRVSSDEQTPEKYKEVINQMVADKALPESAKQIDVEVLSNVLSGDYHSRLLQDADMRSEINPNFEDGNEYSLQDYITRLSMDVPLETLPVATNVLGVLTSPYLAKKANVDNELGVSRFDLQEADNPNLPEKYKDTYAQMTDVYKDEVTRYISEIVSGIDGVVDEDGNVTDYGKFVVSQVTPDLTKFLLTKALNPDSNIVVNRQGNGEFDFTGVDESSITLQSLGIPFNAMSSEDEARIVVKKLKNGLADIPQSLVDALKTVLETKFSAIKENDYKVAEMLLSRTESGLGWRIDAAKDIASIGSVREGVDSMTKAWDDVTDFWKRYNETVLAENPHAYTTAEITDLYDLFKAENPILYQYDPLDSYVPEEHSDDVRTSMATLLEKKAANDGKIPFDDLTVAEKTAYDKVKARHQEKINQALEDAKYKSDADAERKFLEATGITALANYSYFFSLLPNMFAHNAIEDGGTNDNWMARQSENHQLREKLDKGWDISGDYGVPNTPGFLFNSPADGVANSYTFVGNHDKPRALHGLALDMGLFHSKFKPENPKNEEHVKMAELHKSTARKVLQQPSLTNFDEVNSMAVAMGARLSDAFAQTVTDKTQKAAIDKAIAQLASGSYKGKDFDATAFGTRPFEVAIRSVLEQVAYNGVYVSNAENVEAETLKNILEPAFDRFYSIYKLLITLPGSPTDFAGDKVAATGYETKSKNYYQQNRNVIHWEWLNDSSDNKYSFVKDFYNQMNKISELRTKPELSALNDGATVTLPVIASAKDKEGNVTATWNDCTVQAMLRYNDEGSVVLTLHNLSGSKTKLDKKMARTDQALSTDTSIYNKVILAPIGVNAKQGLKHGLKIGTTFKNQRTGDDSTYRIGAMTVDGKEYYCLRRYDKSGKELPVTITPDDLNTLILYKN